MFHNTKMTHHSLNVSIQTKEGMAVGITQLGNGVPVCKENLLQNQCYVGILVTEE